MDEQFLKDEEEALRQQIAQLSPNQKKLYYRLEVKRIKDPDTYAALNYFFIVGLHHFYLGKNLNAVIDIALLVIGLLTITSYGWVLLAAVSLYECFQLFNSQKILHQYNNQVMRSTLAEVSKMTQADLNKI